MACECRTGNRTLVLYVDDPTPGVDALYEFSLGDAWKVDNHTKRIAVHIGPDSPWTDVRQVINFLRTVLPEQSLGALQSGWKRGCCSDPTGNIEDVKPLLQRCATQHVPLLEMLQNKRIETWFQPVLDQSTMSIWGYECLMRGRGPDGELYSPATLLKWADEEHLVFMLDRVCREIHIANAAAANLPEHARILINFLPTAVYDPAFCLRTTEAAVKRVGLDPSRIIFESVETERVDDTDNLVRILEHYRSNGYGVALDDVGAGYSGLAMLADLNPDLIKIDRAIVRSAPGSLRHHAVCKALITLAKDLGKLVLAEGIETASEAQCMAELGADLVQGYRFGKPSPVPMIQDACPKAA